MNAQKFFEEGETLYKKEDFQNALDKYTAALKEDPNYVDALIKRGLVYRKMGNYGASILDFGRVLYIKPANKSALENKGVSLLNLG
ncbi:tetratricopeptide repeat protein [Methanosarcina sp. Mfa9]|uniref:tetratricopeptide repeat protein n=1 Tax=Methanosarcina sp. Mfa9 TaxID=3439063 RepID=UPI003F83936E